MDSTGSQGPTVGLSTGRVRGQVEHGVAVFRGMPFARPPVGALRLAAPAPVPAWDGVRDALVFGPPPPQSRAMGAPVARDGDDDWLTVNVWSPDLGAAGLPVMVWIHGGGYVYGWSGDPLFDGATLARDGVVVVTFNYRVSAEGFGQLPGAPANRGLLDQVAALRWVQGEIAAFGGDPARVTVFGESAGAGCIAALLAMPSARGLFQRAIAQSVPGLCFTDDLATDVGAAVAEQLGVGSSAREVAGVPASLLNEAADAAAASVATRSRWGIASALRSPFAPVVDGDVLPAAPWRALAEGASSDVDLVVGHTRDEYRLFLVASGELGQITEAQADVALRALAPDAAAFRAAYPSAGPEQLYELVHSDVLFRMPSLRLGEVHRGHTHVYEIAWDAPGMGGGVLGACHGLGLPLTFGNLTAGAAAFLIGDVSEEAADLSRRVRSAWTSFAATGDPGWPLFTEHEPTTWVIDTDPVVRRYPEETSRQLWADHEFAPVDLVAGS